MKDRIISLMKHMGMSQKVFAAEICISEGALSSIFSGRTKPTLNTVNNIHERFPEVNMRIRKQALGDKNIVGAKIEQRRKELEMKQFELLAALNAKGIELNASGLSKIEGQIRSVNDYELKAFAEVLKISVNDLLGIEN